MIRTDERLLDSPPIQVDCKHCGATVLARKSSWQQTSVQWSADAMARCVERREAPKPFLVCSKLRQSIEDAARSGAVSILDEVNA